MIWTPSLVAYWNFSSGTAAPSLGSASVAGTSGGGYVASSFQGGAAALFSGGRLDFAERIIPEPYEGFTVAFWINPDDHVSNGFVLGNARSSSQTGVRMLIVAGNTLHFAYGDGTASEWAFLLSVPLGVSEWQHVTATYDAETHQAALFRNGAPAGQTAPVSLPSGVSEMLAIGERHNGTQAFSGSIAHLGIWRGAAEHGDARRLWIGKHPFKL